MTGSMRGPTSPIGVFDSGVGGLSVLQELRRALPRESFVYVADSGHCPYGGKSAEAIRERASALTEVLLEQGAKLVVVACNSATVAAVEDLRARFPVAFVGMEPAVKPAAALTRSDVVGVLSTAVTAQGDRLQRLIREHAQGVQVLTQPCPGLVERVEAGDLDSATTRDLVARYVTPLTQAGADVIVLGCTHYPFLRRVITEAAGPGVALIDTGAAVARRAASLLARDGLLADTDASTSIRWFTTGDVDNFEAVATRLMAMPVHANALESSRDG